MGDTSIVRVGDRGRVVLPSELRSRHGWSPGTTLHLVDSDEGVLLLTREQLRDRVRRSLAGTSLVDELLTERRRAAAEEDEV